MDIARNVSRTEDGAEKVVESAKSWEDYLPDAQKIKEQTRKGKEYKVNTDGLRNEVPLTETQKVKAIEFAESLGMPRNKIVTSEYELTAYGESFDWLKIGTDILPKADVGVGTRTANSRISWRGAIGHEIIGHRAASLAGKSQSIEVLEEAQSSIRAARFTPELSSVERITLLRDAINRLRKNNYKIREIKDQLWINEK